MLELFLLELFFEEPPLDFAAPVLLVDLVVCAELALVDDMLDPLLFAQEEKSTTVARQTMVVRMDFFIR